MKFTENIMVSIIAIFGLALLLLVVYYDVEMANLRLQLNSAYETIDSLLIAKDHNLNHCERINIYDSGYYDGMRWRYHPPKQ